MVFAEKTSSRRNCQNYGGSACASRLIAPVAMGGSGKPCRRRGMRHVTGNMHLRMRLSRDGTGPRWWAQSPPPQAASTIAAAWDATTPRAIGWCLWTRCANSSRVALECALVSLYEAASASFCLAASSLLSSLRSK